MAQKRFYESGYQRKLRDPRWQKLRLELLTAAGWKCEDARCGCADRNLQVHHIYYERGRDPWDYPCNAFLVLCDECHEKRAEIERALKRWLVESIRDVPVEFLGDVGKSMIAELQKHEAITDSRLPDWLLAEKEANRNQRKQP